LRRENSHILVQFWISAFESLKISFTDDHRCSNALVNIVWLSFSPLDFGVYSRRGRFIYITWWELVLLCYLQDFCLCSFVKMKTLFPLSSYCILLRFIGLKQEVGRGRGHSIPCSGWIGEISLGFEHFADAVSFWVLFLGISYLSNICRTRLLNTVFPVVVG
jgi:hypothetical protein